MRARSTYPLRFTVLILIILTLSSLYLINPAHAEPCAILRISLPDGLYVGLDSDPWLSEGWLLNLTGASQTFTVRINNTSTSKRSYNTRVVIVLNDMGYSNLLNLVVNGTSVPKSAFRYGTPEPYNLWTWPSGDVYPTWFEDTYVNVGTVLRDDFKDIVVSVTFSDAAGVKMHFDVYGSRTTSPPTSSGSINHNPSSEDSTVLFQTGAPAPQPPTASFFFVPSYPTASEPVTFNASGSYDTDGYIASYSWNFGDGTPVVTEGDPITSHIYTTFGSYTANLTVTDNDGLTDSYASTVNVRQRPVAAFTFSPPDPLWHEAVIFDASASMADGGVIVSYKWNFGDGNTQTVTYSIISHTYSTLGNYIVTLNVTDSEGKWDTESEPITIEGLPLADFWWKPYRPEKYEVVTFNASDSTPDGGVLVSYVWDFGDGTPMLVEADPVTTHFYTANGSFTVTLNITDSEGRWDAQSKTINVNPLSYYLTVKTNPGGVTTIPGENWYYENTDVSLTAPEFLDVSVTIRYRFDYWGVDGISQGTGVNSIVVHMAANHTTTAHYVLQYYLMLTTSSGGVTNPSISEWHDAGVTVQVTAVPDLYYLFDHWELNGVDAGSANPYNLLMDGAHTLHAVFVQEMSTLTVTASTGGTTDPAPDSYVYPAGTYVAVTAIPDTNYVFDHWELDDANVGSENPYNVFLNTDHTLHAVFVYSPPNHYLTARTDPTGVATISGEGWYIDGQNVALTAPDTVTVSSGVRYKFTHWDVDGTPQGAGVNPIAVIMNANHTATAHYMVQYYLTSTSPYGSPTPASGWFDAGTSITASVTSPTAGGTGTRYVCTGWTGTGSVPPSGTASSVTFAINAPSTVAWNWKTQHYLTVKTNPSGIASIPGGGWYDESTSVPLTAPLVWGHDFLHWDVDGASQGANITSISVTINAPRTAIACYQEPSTVVGGHTVSIKSPAFHTWISINATLVAAIFLATFWMKRRRRK